MTSGTRFRYLLVDAVLGVTALVAFLRSLRAAKRGKMRIMSTFFSRFGRAFEATGKDWAFPSLSFVVMWLGLWKWVAWHQEEGLIAVGFIAAVNFIFLALAPPAVDDETDTSPSQFESSDAEPKREKRQAWWRPIPERLRDRYRTLRLPGIIVGLVLITVTIGFSDWFIREGLDGLMVAILPAAFCAALALLMLGKGAPFGH